MSSYCSTAVRKMSACIFEGYNNQLRYCEDVQPSQLQSYINFIQKQKNTDKYRFSFWRTSATLIEYKFIDLCQPKKFKTNFKSNIPKYWKKHDEFCKAIDDLKIIANSRSIDEYELSVLKAKKRDCVKLLKSYNLEIKALCNKLKN